MRGGVAGWVASLICGIQAAAQAQTPDGEATPQLRPEPAFVSPLLLDPRGRSRFHLTTRGLFSDGQDVFSSSSTWAFEGRFYLQLLDGLAVTGGLPFGLSAPAQQPNRFFIGNVTVGVLGGGRVDLERPEGPNPPMRLHFGGGFDVYFPTAPDDEGGPTTLGAVRVAAMRGYEPQLYVPKLMSARTRFHVALTAGGFRAGVELSIVPGVTVTDPANFALLVGGAGHLGYDAGVIEPFVMAGGVTQVAGDGDIAPPLFISPGVRLHLARYVDPALFVSFNFVGSTAVIFGLDLAGVLDADDGLDRDRGERGEKTDDFLDF